MEVKPAEFARLAGVSRPSISGKIKNKTLIINAAGMLDTENPVNATYLSRHKERQEQKNATEYINASKTEKFPKGNFPETEPAVDELAMMKLAGVPAVELLNMTMKEIVMYYPGLKEIERYIKILKETTITAEKEQRLHERSLVLIPKDFVTARLFGFLNMLAKQIIADFPESAVDQVIALVMSGGEKTRINVIAAMRNRLELILTKSKEQIITELESLKPKYQKTEMEAGKLEAIRQVIEK